MLAVSSGARSGSRREICRYSRTEAPPVPGTMAMRSPRLSTSAKANAGAGSAAAMAVLQHRACTGEICRRRRQLQDARAQRTEPHLELRMGIRDAGERGEIPGFERVDADRAGASRPSSPAVVVSSGVGAMLTGMPAMPGSNDQSVLRLHDATVCELEVSSVSGR